MAACEDWEHIHCPITKLWFYHEKGRWRVRLISPGWADAAYAPPAGSQKEISHAYGRTYVITVLPNRQFCLYWKKITLQNLGSTLETSASKLFSVKRKGKKNNMWETVWKNHGYHFHFHRSECKSLYLKIGVKSFGLSTALKLYTFPFKKKISVRIGDF